MSNRRAGVASARPLLAGLALGVVLGVSGCGGGTHSSAADPYIAQAGDAEEREALIAARDDIDAEMGSAAVEKDAVIERLRKENEDLRAQLAARGIKP